MIIIDTSAWIEFFRQERMDVAQKVKWCLDNDLVGIGDIIYCEIMQGVSSVHQQKNISSLLLSIACFEMVGFPIAEKAAANYRMLRSRGITVRKTIDVLIGTFCVENNFSLVHCDSDFDLMKEHVGLRVV